VRGSLPVKVTSVEEKGEAEVRWWVGLGQTLEVKYNCLFILFILLVFTYSFSFFNYFYIFCYVGFIQDFGYFMCTYGVCFSYNFS